MGGDSAYSYEQFVTILVFCLLWHDFMCLYDFWLLLEWQIWKNKFVSEWQNIPFRDHHRRWDMDLWVWSGDKASFPINGKVIHLHTQRGPGRFAWLPRACWSCSLVLTLCTMNLSHSVKLLTSTSKKVSYSIYGRLIDSDIQENGTLVIGCCVWIMFLLTQTCLCNIWPRVVCFSFL
jgi:hypothetical protein